MDHITALRRLAPRIWLSLLPALLVAIAVPVAQARTLASSTITLNGAGSTFIYPLMQAWTAAYAKVDPSVSIRYQSIGSGGGIQLFDTHAVDFAASDAFLTDDEIAAAGGDVLHIPLTLGPESVIYNIPSLKRPLRLDGLTLAQIYFGTIRRWNDPSIRVLNAGVTLPDLPITVTHRLDGSGTTFIFTSYLTAVSDSWRSSVGSGLDVNWPTGVPGRGNGGVAALVKQTVGGIGYVQLSYAIANGLPMALIQNRAGLFVAPTVAGAVADAANAGRIPADLRAAIVNAPGAASYPISGFSWALIHQHAPNQAVYVAVLKFLWWCIHAGQKLASTGTLRYAPLPSNVVRLEEAKIRSVTFDGRPLFIG